MDANSEKKIKVLPNGPYEVIGDIPLNQLRYVNDRKGASTGYKEIQKYAPEGVYHLCRCGGSHNKPFCDGTHKKNGFKGDTTASHDTYDEMSVLYEGKVIDMLDAESLCAVARFCDTHGTSWEQVEEGDSAETIEIVTSHCRHERRKTYRTGTARRHQYPRRRGSQRSRPYLGERRHPDRR